MTAGYTVGKIDYFGKDTTIIQVQNYHYINYVINVYTILPVQFDKNTVAIFKIKLKEK